MSLIHGTKEAPVIVHPKLCPVCSTPIGIKECWTCALAAEKKDNQLMVKEMIRLLNIIAGQNQIITAGPGTKKLSRAAIDAATVTHGFDGLHIPKNYPWLK